MKKIATIVLLTFVLAVVARAQANGPTPVITNVPTTTPAAKATPVTLNDVDQKELDQLAQSIAQMLPNTKKAEQQAQDAERALAQANSFISQFNELIARRTALMNRIAADYVGCKTTELELAADGRTVMKKPSAK